MVLAVALLYVFVVASQALKEHHGLYSQSKLLQFNQWMDKHGKKYATDEEYQTRLNNYFENAKRAKVHNERSKQLNSTATFGINKFADLTPAEFKRLLGTKLSQETMFAEVAPAPTAQPPQSFDWRTRGGITGQKNELQCGSCWAMTVVMAIESAYMIHKGKKDQQPLSTQQIIDCDTADDGCNGGNPPTAYQYVVTAGGLETNAQYPYTGEDGTCKAMKSLEQDPITGFQYAIPQGSKDEIALANFLATNQPYSTAVDAESWQLYTGGIMLASQCGTDIDHGVQVVGYNGLTSSGYWIVRNMWGSDWGENGFIRLQFGENTCGITSLPTAPTLPN